MSDQSQSPPVSNNELLDALRAQAAQIEKLTRLVSDQETRLAAVSLGKLPDAEIHAPVSLNGGSFEDSDIFFVRLKPYNKNKGHLRMRTFLREVGKYMNGGTGNFGDVPEWFQVTREVAEEVAKYRQDDNRQDSPPLLDIVTPAERAAIDQMENAQRMAGLGLAGATPSEALAMAKQVEARTRQMAAPKTARTAPDLVTGVAKYHQPETAVRPAAPPPPPSAAPAFGRTQALPVVAPPAPALAPGQDIGGREAALEGFDDFDAPENPSMPEMPGDLAAKASRISETALLGAAAQFKDEVAGSNRRGSGRAR